MLKENKLSNYLVYAIGEIILVVIGILLALQINTINQNRLKLKQEKILLDQVRTELQIIYGDIWRDEARLTLGLYSHYNIINHIEEDSPYVDSLCFDFYWLKMDEYIYPTEAAYSKLKEEGLEIIQNDTIRYYLQSIYEGQFPRLKKENSFNPDISLTLDEYYLNSFRPNYNYDLKFTTSLENDTVGAVIYTNESYSYPYDNQTNGKQSTVGYVPLNFVELKKDPKFLMLLDQTRKFRNYKIERYRTTAFLIKEVVMMIDKFIE